jgi:trk system potassium uptake protein TrkA
VAVASRCSIDTGARWLEGDVPLVHVVIMGCGRVGASLARQLIRLEHSVAVIDQNPDAFRRLGDSFTGRTVTGMGFDRETLVSAGIEEAGAFAAVSSGDNSNIIGARVARETFGVEKVVARIYDAKRAEVYERLGIPTIATVPWTATRLLKSVLGEALAESWRDPSGSIVMLQVDPHEGWVGQRIKDFELATGGRAALITRFGVGELPQSSSVIQDGDLIHMLATEPTVAQLRAIASTSPNGVRA